MATIKIENIERNSISDGHHTFQELYDHRALLFIFLCLQNKNECVWKYSDEDYFLLYYKSKYGQISYHIENKYLYLIKDIIKNDPHYKFDGSTPGSVIARLNLLTETFDEDRK